MSIDKKLMANLNKMVIADQKARKVFQKTGILSSTVDKKNARKIKTIIKKHGWPTVQLVGRSAAKAAWLIAQHIRHDICFQKKCLQLMKQSFRDNPTTVEKIHLAMLQDRILFNEGKKQLFGTQYYFDKNRRLILWPIKDLKGLTERRREYNIKPFTILLQKRNK